MSGNHRVVPRVLRVLEVALLLICLASLYWVASARAAAAREQASLSRELDRIGASTPAAFSAPAVRGLVGRIDVPRLKLSALAREGADVGTLRRAVGHIPGTALPGDPGNSGFAAHRDTFFRPLKSVRNGDEVILTTTRGVYTYLVTGTRIVDPEDVSVLDPTPAATLTLVTCYPFEYVGSAPQRFIVHAALQAADPTR